jgi:hypothetical protein
VVFHWISLCPPYPRESQEHGNVSWFKNYWQKIQVAGMI